MAKFVVDDAVSGAWGRLTSDASTTSWIACGYPEGSSNQLVFKGEGAGGMPEFLAKLPADDIVWGAIKVVAVDDRGNLVSRRPKYVMVKYAPPTVAAMKRAKSGGHKGAVKQVFTSHVDIEVESVDELTEESIIVKLRACGGAHQPTSYEFSNYSGTTSPLPSSRSLSPAPTPASNPAPVPAPAPAPAVVTPEPEPVVPPAAVEETSTTTACTTEEAAAAAPVNDEATGLEEDTEALAV
mmetsp:Transcript_82845/g.162414  ORF Transcript_82845/g.162414 Transcript_82845/m.162414 type:complete len:239 (-) Transcript_82845:155-871(-)